MKWLKDISEDGGDGSLYLGELPGMGDSAGFPQEPAGMGQPHSSTLPADWTEDPDEEKKKRMSKKMKNLKGFVEFLGGDPE
jgi:hypothetical protein